MKYFCMLLLLISSLYSQEIDTKISYFEQKNVEKKIEILSQKFTTLDSKHSNFGFSKSIFWVKVESTNSDEELIEQVIDISYPLLDFIDIYEIKDKELFLKKKYGDLRVYNNDNFSPNPSFLFRLNPKAKKSFLLKIETQGSMNIDIKVSSYSDFVDTNVEKAQALTFYFGASLIMILYNFILFLFIRDRSFVFYLIFHIDYLIFALALNGYAFMHFWPESPDINNYAVPFLMSLGSTLAIIFTLDFLQIKEKSAKLFKMLTILLWINAIATLSVFILNYHHTLF